MHQFNSNLVVYHQECRPNGNNQYWNKKKDIQRDTADVNMYTNKEREKKFTHVAQVRTDKFTRSTGAVCVFGPAQPSKVVHTHL